jgi:hypothetical protein
VPQLANPCTAKWKSRMSAFEDIILFRPPRSPSVKPLMCCKSCR